MGRVLPSGDEGEGGGGLRWSRWRRVGWYEGVWWCVGGTRRTGCPDLQDSEIKIVGQKKWPEFAGVTGISPEKMKMVGVGVAGGVERERGRES